jgi:hypothetical protein
MTMTTGLVALLLLAAGAVRASAQATTTPLLCAGSAVSLWATALPDGVYRAHLFGASTPDSWVPLGTAAALVSGGDTAAFFFPVATPAFATAHALAALVLPALPPASLAPEAPAPGAAPGPIPPALAAAAVQQVALLSGAPAAAGCAALARTGGAPPAPAALLASLERQLAQLAPSPSATPTASAADANALDAQASGAPPPLLLLLAPLACAALAGLLLLA